MRTVSTPGIALPQVMIVALLMVFGANANAQNSATGPNQPQVAQPKQGGVNWKGVGVGAGTVASNLLYVPAKLTYGILGGIAGGAGFLFTGGNKQVADTIWRSSLGGDYVLTPDMLTGKHQVHFSGPTTIAPADSSPVGASSSYGSASGYTADSSVAARPSPVNPGGSAAATHAIDSGAGPVSGANPATVPDPANGTDNSNSYLSTQRQMPKLKAPPLPDTSIE